MPVPCSNVPRLSKPLPLLLEVLPGIMCNSLVSTKGFWVPERLCAKAQQQADGHVITLAAEN